MKRRAFLQNFKFPAIVGAVGLPVGALNKLDGLFGGVSIQGVADLPHYFQARVAPVVRNLGVNPYHFPKAVRQVVSRSYWGAGVAHPFLLINLPDSILSAREKREVLDYIRYGGARPSEAIEKLKQHEVSVSFEEGFETHRQVAHKVAKRLGLSVSQVNKSAENQGCHGPTAWQQWKESPSLFVMDWTGANDDIVALKSILKTSKFRLRFAPKIGDDPNLQSVRSAFREVGARLEA